MRYAPRPDRPPVRSAANVTRYDWMRALQAGGTLALEATAEAEPAESFGRRLGELRGWLRDLSAENFPYGSMTARLLAGAWLNAARAFVLPEAAPETRTACAPVVIASERALDELMAPLRAEQAQQSWGRQFPRDE